MSASPRRVTAILTVLGTACGGDGGGAAPPSGELLVSAASSLTDAFREIALAFEGAHPEIDVVLNLAGSATLAAQILEGAPADVFASADAAQMERIAVAGHLSGESRVFARNTLQIAVPAGNPAGVVGLGDFHDEGLRLGLCAERVPCGDLARRVLERADVVPALDTNEPNVRSLLGKIELGELDAGVTYRTDVASTGGAVQGIDIPGRWNLVAAYPIGVLDGAPHQETAQAFVRFVLSEPGRAILARHGFLLP